jgi:hypothetical protein
MGKIIIGIHGMGNKPRRNILQAWWKTPIYEGLKRSRKPNQRFRFELFYWAHHLYPSPLQPRIKDRKHPLFIEEPYFPSGNQKVKKPSRLRIKILDFLNRQLDRFFLEEDFTINHESISDFVIHHYFKDLEKYYGDHCDTKDGKDCGAKPIICNHFAKVIRKHRRKKIMLIAHSMGAIIAYDVLTAYAPEVAIDTFVTIGAPLGLPVIKSRFVEAQREKNPLALALKTPENIRSKWFNLSDLRDKIAVNYMLEDDFGQNAGQVRPTDKLVTNDYEYRGDKNPHKSYGYLRTPEMADIIAEFLSEDRFRLFSWLNIFQKKKKTPVPPSAGSENPSDATDTATDKFQEPK